MKRTKTIFSIFFLFLCLSLLASCGADSKKEQNSELFSPLFRFTVKEGESDKTRLFYMPESEGFLYLHPSEKGGFTGGFVSPERSLSAEGLIQSEGDISSLTVWERGEDQGILLGEKSLLITLLNEKGLHETPLPDAFSTEGAFPLDSLSFVTKKDNLLLVHPIDLKETFVLADTALLPDFAHLVATSGDGRYLWYAKADAEGNYTGIAFFEYGKNIPLGDQNFPFDKVQRVGEDALLFSRNLEDGKTLYIYRDLSENEVRGFTSDKAFEGVICDEDGEILCGTSVEGEGGSVTVIDLKKGREKGVYTIDYGTPAPSLAIDEDGETLLLAVGKKGDEILGTLDLKRF